MLRKNAAAKNEGDVMSVLYILSRILVAFFGVTTLLGVLWFAGSISKILTIAGVLLGLASLAAAFVPQRKLSSDTTRRTLVMLCAVGTGAGLILVADNFSASNAIEWHVVMVNLLHVTAFTVIAARAFMWPTKPM